MSMVRGVMVLAISAIVATEVLLNVLHNTNTSGWSTSEIALWGTAGLMVVVGIVYGIGSVFGVI